MKPKTISTRRRTVASPAQPSVVQGLKATQASAQRKRIVLVDDHPMMRAGLAQLINKQPDLEVCCEAGQPGEALIRISNNLPDLVITDITLPGRGGLEFIKDLKALHPHLAVLVISMHDEDLHAERALRAGARGYIMKEAGAERMLEGIRKVLAGDVFISERVAARIIDAFSGRRPRGSHSPIEKLSDREFRIFELIGRGLSTRAIAAELNLSPKTVDVHRTHIKEKLALDELTSLVCHAVRWVELEKPNL
jgi:DNA-binding NarL/FixJ family response regulator